MKKKTLIPISAMLGALLLAIVAAMTPFVDGQNIAHAQTATGITVGGKAVANFDADRHNYTGSPIRVSSTTTHISVSASPGAAASLHSIKYSLNALNSGTNQDISGYGGTAVTNNSVPLAAGVNTDIAFLMTTGATPTNATAYVVRVTRVSASAKNDADLSNLEVTGIPTGVAFSPTFASSTTSYTLALPYDVDDADNDTDDQITVTATRSDNVDQSATAGSKVTITSDKDSTITGDGNNQVNLEEGRNVISIKVEAANVVTTKTYTLTVTRAAENASDDARLSSLTVGGKTVPASNIELSDGGDENVDYITKVSNATSSVQVRANTRHSGAKVVIRTGASASESVAGDIDADGNIPLSVGTKFIAVQVTAEDRKSASRKNYILSVTRVAQNASSVATLSGLTITNPSVTLSPAFASGTTSYRAFVPYDLDSTSDGTQDEITVSGTATGAGDGATVKITPDDANSTTSGHQVELAQGSNTITVMVEAADVVTTKTYTITVTRASQTALDDARLSSLRVGGESVSVTGFNGTDDTVDHTTSVPNASSFVQVVATPMDSNASVAIRSHADSASQAIAGPVDADGRIPLDPGNDMFISVQVTAANGSTVRNYVLSVTRAVQGASSNAKLAASGGIAIVADSNVSVTFSPSYDADVTSYTASVPYDVDDGQAGGAGDDEITVTATGANSGATVTVSSDKDTSVGDTNAASHISASGVNLEEGANVITIKVKAADALATKTYTVTVTRAAENASDDAGLSSLTVGGESITLPLTASDSAAAYVTGVANSVNSIQINATAMHSGATIALRRGTNPGASIIGRIDADGNIPLIVGYTNFIAVQVTAEDGKSASSKNYILQVNRPPASASSDAKLDALTLTSGTLTPTFDEDKTEYTADVDNSISSVTVTATGRNGDVSDDATVTIMSDTDDTISDSTTGDQQLHLATYAIDLKHGANVITINVTAADYETTGAYTVTITRAAPADDSSLSALSLTETDGTAVDLHYMDSDGMDMTGFMSDITSYTAMVEKDIDKVTVAPTTAATAATFTYSDGDGNALTDADTATDGMQVSLEHGDNTVKVSVTSEDISTTTDYTVVVTREPLLSDDASLSDLTVDSGTLTPEFDSETIAYTVDVEASVSSIMVTATANDDMATVSGDGSHDLVTGDNTITITVTAEDTTMMMYYTVVVTRAASSDATLASLMVGDATIELVDGTTGYAVAVENAVESVVVTATASHSAATVAVVGGDDLDVGDNTITVTVTAEDGTTTMAYTITVTRAEPPCDRPLTENTAVGMFSADCPSMQRTGSYAVRYSFTPTVSGDVSITLTSGDADPYLYLLDSTGKKVIASNDDDEGFNSGLTASLTAGMTYVIEATTYGAADDGSFVLSVTGAGLGAPPAGDACDAMAIASDDDVTGTLSDACMSSNEDRAGSYALFYSITLDSASTVSIELSAANDSGVDPYLYVTNADGDIVAENDDDDGLNSAVSVDLAAGTYTIEATTYGPADGGDITLTVSGLD